MALLLLFTDLSVLLASREPEVVPAASASLPSLCCWEGQGGARCRVTEHGLAAVGKRVVPVSQLLQQWWVHRPAPAGMASALVRKPAVLALQQLPGRGDSPSLPFLKGCSWAAAGPWAVEKQVNFAHKSFR